MHKLFISVLAIFSFTIIFSQENFEWKNTISVSKTKSEIYSDIKLFIATNWNSLDDVIKLDDKEGGIIFLKGLTKSISFVQMGATYSYTYSYSLTFKIKDNSFDYTINKVSCYSTVGSSFQNKLLIEPHEIKDCEYANKKFGEKCNQLMSDLKVQLHSISNLCENSLK